MLAIRMQRIGRKGHASFRVVVQDSRQAPTSGKFVARLGSYDPHTKVSTLEKEKAELYLKNGARPSDRVVLLFKKEGIKLPAWVKDADKKTKALKNPEKLRRNRPAEEKPAAVEETPVETKAPDAELAAEAEAPETEEGKPEEPVEESTPATEEKE